METNNPTEQQEKTCKVMARQDTTVSVPVTIKPRVNAGNANVYCCGKSKISPAMCIPKCKTYATSTEFRCLHPLVSPCGSSHISCFLNGAGKAAFIIGSNQQNKPHVIL